MRIRLYLPLLTAAIALAAALLPVGGRAFAQEQGVKAEWLGLQCTHFANPHGLDEEGLPPARLT